jgi:hypothetical protein
MTSPNQTTTKHKLADVLNPHLASRLRVEFVSAENTETTGQVNLTELAEAVASELRVIEQMLPDQLPHQFIWDQNGLRFVFLVRERTADEVGSPVVDPTP